LKRRKERIEKKKKKKSEKKDQRRGFRVTGKRKTARWRWMLNGCSLSVVLEQSRDFISNGVNPQVASNKDQMRAGQTGLVEGTKIVWKRTC
jgi:hypothetical protein